MRTAILFCGLVGLLALLSSDSSDVSVTTSEVVTPTTIQVPDITVDQSIGEHRGLFGPAASDAVIADYHAAMSAADQRATVKQIIHLVDRSTGRLIGTDWLVVGIYHNDDLPEALKVNQAVAASVTAEIDFGSADAMDDVIAAYKEAGFTRVDIYARDAVPTADPAFDEVDTYEL